MDVNITRIFEDPNLYFHAFGPENNLTFLPMDRDHFAASQYYDQRIEPAERTVFRVPRDPVLKAYRDRGFRRPSAGYLYHTGKCGANLLARSLDVAGKSLSLREPVCLDQLARMEGPRFDPEQPSKDFGAMLGLALTLLGKRYGRTDTLVVKGSVPTALIAEGIDRADPERPTILQYLPLENHLAAFLASNEGEDGPERTIGDLGLADMDDFADLKTGGAAHRAAALWLIVIRQFQKMEDRNWRVRTLDGDRLLTDPVETVLSASVSYDVFLQRADAEAIANGPLFASGSGADSSEMSANETGRRKAAMDRFGEEIGKAREWAEKKAADLGLRPAFKSSLVGEPEPLF